ncbi:UTRA domain-containing protein [Streptomyces sp. NBC_00006]|uniref:GntR family transcriptional regulator n=1 Tax=Streptomyces sp. NBC_00006 TaxID=2975619 RepID=UPI00224E0D05|nr:UTRA domain-containing protein [Streptomyces sp. NBC_00006]MCX5528966.1 UTRA domain-containing protein [Streptomyces sp. NBC_00006]MCX5537802.1 UTRA domain-containing protein [Streptomyces sp. NBC_00006]
MTDPQWTGASAPYIRPKQGDAWGKEAAAQGRSGTQRILFAGEVAAPDEVAAAMDTEPGATVILRRRLVLLDDTPVELADSYWPLTVAAGTALASPGKVKGGAPTLLAELGYEPADVAESIRTRPATPEERKALAMEDPGEWVLTLRRTVKDASTRPYEVFVSVAPGRVGQLNYSMKVS